jgi:hypothetical protein
MLRHSIWKCGVVVFLLCFLPVSVAESAVMPEGAYRGTFIGDRYGSFVLTVDRDGYISGELFFNKTSTAVPLKGNCTSEGNCEFQALDGNLVFRGTVDQFNRFIGRWLVNEGEERGSFYGMKQ